MPGALALGPAWSFHSHFSDWIAVLGRLDSFCGPLVPWRGFKAQIEIFFFFLKAHGHCLMTEQGPLVSGRMHLRPQCLCCLVFAVTGWKLDSLWHGGGEEWSAKSLRDLHRPEHLHFSGPPRALTSNYQTNHQAWNWRISLLPQLYWPGLVTGPHITGRETGECSPTVRPGAEGMELEDGFSLPWCLWCRDSSNVPMCHLLQFCQGKSRHWEIWGHTASQRWGHCLTLVTLPQGWSPLIYYSRLRR